MENENNILNNGALKQTTELTSQDFSRYCDLINNEILSKGSVRDIPPMFTEIPEGYVNNVAHRGNYSEEEMNETLEDGTRKLLHLDLDFGKVCRLCCPHCFKRNNELQNLTDKKELSEEELKTVVLKFKELGLKSIKVCGAGEPFDNSEFLPLLRWLHENNIGVSVFTKGYIIGNDDFVRTIYGKYGINNSKELCDELKRLDVSILLSLNSFDPEIQKKYSGATVGPMSGIYIKSRDNALLNLMKAGLNEFIPGEPTRLAVIMAPMKPENLNEVHEIYQWARMRNLYPLGCPANNAGRGKDENERVLLVDPNYEEDLVNLYSKLYIWNIEHKITTLEQVEKYGISLYPGCHPCTQTRIGGYINLYGEMLSCPGHDTEIKGLKICGNVAEEQDFKEIWKKSANYKRTGFNQHCIARDGISLSPDFYDRIMVKIKEYFDK